MWKKLQLIRILCTNALGLLSLLYDRNCFLVRANNWADRIIRQRAIDDKVPLESKSLLISCGRCKTRLQALSYDEQDASSSTARNSNIPHNGQWRFARSGQELKFC